MASVTGYTAERMQEIEDAAIVDGNVVGGDLILTRYDTSTINAGSVIGPTGPAGAAGTSSPTIVTSGTRPGSPTAGTFIYESDTKRLYVWDGTIWRYVSGKWICTSATRPASPFEGLEIYETDTNREYIHDGTNWIQKSGPLNWQTPTLTNSWVHAAAYSAPRYALIDGEVRVEGHIRTGTSGQAAFTLATGYRPPDNRGFATYDGANAIGKVEVFATGLVIPTVGNNTLVPINFSFRID